MGAITIHPGHVLQFMRRRRKAFCHKIANLTDTVWKNKISPCSDHLPQICAVHN